MVTPRLAMQRPLGKTPNGHPKTLKWAQAQWSNFKSDKSHGHGVGTEWAQIGHKTKKAHRSEPLL